MKKKHKSCLFIALAIVLYLSGSLFYLKILAWEPILSDGPFQGKPRTSHPTKAPDQEMEIMDGMTLKVFDKTYEDPAPTVLLQNKNGDTLWCIYAIGSDNTKITMINFLDYQTFPFCRPKVIGTVNWKNITSTTSWFIDESGKLEEYWYKGYCD